MIDALNTANIVSPRSFAPARGGEAGQAVPIEKTPTQNIDAENETSQTEQAVQAIEESGDSDSNTNADTTQRQATPSVLNNGSANPNELTEAEEKEVQELQQTDREVRAHEQAHKTVGGAYAGVVTYETVTGPDGREYAIAGEVDIDVSAVPNNPEATIRKMDVVIRAALAPAEPSPQDFAVARTAQQIRLQARQELTQFKQEEQRDNEDSAPSPIQELQEEIQNPDRTSGNESNQAPDWQINKAIQSYSQSSEKNTLDVTALFSTQA